MTKNTRDTQELKQLKPKKCEEKINGKWKVRCRICGEPMLRITNSHLKHKHNMDNNDYKEYCEKRGEKAVFYSTTMRRKRQQKTLEKVNKKEHAPQKQDVKKKIAEYREKLSKEEHGNWINQEKIIDDIRKTANSLGETSLTVNKYLEHGEFSNDAIYNHFESWNQALKSANLKNNR